MGWKCSLRPIASWSGWCFSVHGVRSLKKFIHMSNPANIVPIVPPHLAIAGWALRTIFSSSAIQLERTAGS